MDGRRLVPSLDGWTLTCVPVIPYIWERFIPGPFLLSRLAGLSKLCLLGMPRQMEGDGRKEAPQAAHPPPIILAPQ